MTRIAKQYTLLAAITEIIFVIVGIMILICSETITDIVCSLLVVILNLICAINSIRDYKKVNKYIEVNATDLVKLIDFIKANNLTNEKKKEK